MWSYTTCLVNHPKTYLENRQSHRVAVHHSLKPNSQATEKPWRVPDTMRLFSNRRISVLLSSSTSPKACIDWRWWRMDNYTWINSQESYLLRWSIVSCIRVETWTDVRALEVIWDPARISGNNCSLVLVLNEIPCITLVVIEHAAMAIAKKCLPIYSLNDVRTWECESMADLQHWLRSNNLGDDR